MRPLVHRAVLAGIALAALGLAAAAAETGGEGAINQSIPPTVSAKPVPPLHLSDAQRTQIQQALRGENTEVTFGTKTTKPTQSFNPTVGAKIPASLKPHTLPPPVLSQMPELKRYTYLKFKNQVLIVDPMSRKVVEMFPEA
jgi:hypothetical protein